MWESRRDETDICCYLIQIDGDIGRNDQVPCCLIFSKVNRTKSGAAAFRPSSSPTHQSRASSVRLRPQSSNTGSLPFNRPEDPKVMDSLPLPLPLIPMAQPNLWESTLQISSFISIENHNIHLQAAGPPREAGKPVVIIIQGLAQTAASWAAVARLLSPRIRVFRYDRSGFGKSETAPYRPTSTNIARELDLLLKAAGVGGPYILIAHSWGGILAREFIAMSNETVVGCVFVEANQEHTLERLDWRLMADWVREAQINVVNVARLEGDHQMTEEEWNQYVEDIPGPGHRQAEAESYEYAPSFEILAGKEQLHMDPPFMGNFPVAILKGQNGRELNKLYDAVLEIGYGTQAQRAWFRAWLDTFDDQDRALQAELISLSEVYQFAQATLSGHNVHLTEPELVVEKVIWVIDQYRALRALTDIIHGD
jgi:pimeloyl-ACP methyl ester carboxylesterase